MFAIVNLFTMKLPPQPSTYRIDLPKEKDQNESVI